MGVCQKLERDILVGDFISGAIDSPRGTGTEKSFEAIATSDEPGVAEGGLSSRGLTCRPQESIEIGSHARVLGAHLDEQVAGRVTQTKGGKLGDQRSLRFRSRVFVGGCILQAANSGLVLQEPGEDESELKIGSAAVGTRVQVANRPLEDTTGIPVTAHVDKDSRCVEIQVSFLVPAHGLFLIAQLFGELCGVCEAAALDEDGHRLPLAFFAPLLELAGIAISGGLVFRLECIGQCTRQISVFLSADGSGRKVPNSLEEFGGTGVVAGLCGDFGGLFVATLIDQLVDLFLHVDHGMRKWYTAPKSWQIESLE